MAEICIALDGMPFYRAYRLAYQFANKGVWGYKINDLLFDNLQPAQQIVSNLQHYGSVFADVKLHDTPATVANSVRRLALAGAALVSVHASGGRKMVRAAVEAYDGHRPKGGLGIVVITVLTSLSEEDCIRLYCRRPQDAVRSMLDETPQGTYGFVCSAEELTGLAGYRPELKRIVPGTRLSGSARHEHHRTDTPREATKNGADMLVIGREILEAPDTEQMGMLERIQAEVNCAS